MGEFVKAAKKSEIPTDTGKCVEVKGKEIALFKVALDKDDIKTVMKGLKVVLGLAVEPRDKLATTWATLKRNN